ncbi:MAG: hypothetical protein EDM03_07625 [Porphyrobacter sp. IPPAS B-1204]|nr:MAG: hypothetical protein EDM03_07625 [Porphyrobacter sp. IPPAS B-1204]
MYKAVFQNSKVALLFAGMTLFSAVSMVGTSEDKGALTEAVDRFGAQRSAFASNAAAFAEGRSEGDAPPAEKPVFGEFGGGPSASGNAVKPKAGSGPMNAPLSPTAIVSNRSGPTVTGEPYISEREMTLEPE